MKQKQLHDMQILNQFCRLAPPGGVTTRPIAQQNLLFWVAAEERSPTPSTVAEGMGLTKAAVTKMLTPLITEGLLIKTRDPEDNRSFTLSLTPAGQQEVLAISPTYFKPLATIHDALGKKDFRRLIVLLDQATHALTQVD